MKNNYYLLSLLLIAAIIFTSSAFAQNFTAVYKNLSPNFFDNYEMPIGIGIMQFTGGYELEKQFYDVLRKQTGIHDKFVIYPYHVLAEQKQVLKVKQIDPNDSKVLKSLNKNLDIALVILGKGSADEFMLEILRTDDGSKIFEGNYKTSVNSTSLADAVKLFSSNQIAIYEEKPKVPEKMILVEGGYFEMGSKDGDDDEKPVHRVYVNSFYIDKYEVTQREYEKVMGSNPSTFKCPDCPVENVSWNDANEYAKKIDKRLPTEAEWEYAARGGNKSKGYIYSGSDRIEEVGWYDGNSSNKTHEAGTKKPNELGIYDMTGNVWEWCSDWYDEGYYQRSPKNNPTGPSSGTYIVLRGGSWSNFVNSCRVAFRGWSLPDLRYFNYGFRCAQDLK